MQNVYGTQCGILLFTQYFILIYVNDYSKDCNCWRVKFQKEKREFLDKKNIIMKYWISQRFTDELKLD